MTRTGSANWAQGLDQSCEGPCCGRQLQSRRLEGAPLPREHSACELGLKPRACVPERAPLLPWLPHWSPQDLLQCRGPLEGSHPHPAPSVAWEGPGVPPCRRSSCSHLSDSLRSQVWVLGVPALHVLWVTWGWMGHPAPFPSHLLLTVIHTPGASLLGNTGDSNELCIFNVPSPASGPGVLPDPAWLAPSPGPPVLEPGAACPGAASLGRGLRPLPLPLDSSALLSPPGEPPCDPPLPLTVFGPGTEQRGRVCWGPRWSQGRGTCGICREHGEPAGMPPSTSALAAAA